MLGLIAVLGLLTALGCSPNEGAAVAPLGASGSGGDGALGGAGGAGGSTKSSGGAGAREAGSGGVGSGGTSSGSLGGAATEPPAAGTDAGPLGGSRPDAAAPPGDAGVDAGLPEAGPSLDPVLASRYRALSGRLSVLGARTFAFWVEHGPDATFGGFHGTLNRQGNPIGPDDKGLIQQARHLWMLSTWYERREQSNELASLAADTYAFLRDSFVDPADGAFVFKVSRDGSRVVDGKKQMFAESYALYALATYGRVFGVAEATDLALARFESIDEARHDEVFGGYDQRGDPGVGSVQAEKDLNTHLHFLEAFTALYEATREPRVGARLSELADLIAERLLQPSGHVHAEFSVAWEPRGASVVSYGHDLETAWLLLEAARQIGREGDPALRSAALRMAEHSAARGFDAANGGYFEAGVPNGATSDVDKVWWVQFEALLGLWWAYEVGGNALELDRLSSTLDWIERTEDLPAAEWFATTGADGSAVGADYKGDEWKASYHSVRSLAFLQDWIDEKLR